MIFENIEIIDLSNDYKGIAFINNKKCFISNAIVDDIVNLEIIEEKSKYLVGKVLEYIKKSDFRNSEIKCKYFGKCGGCALQYLKEEYYYEIKKQNLLNYIKNSGYNYDINNLEIFKVGFGKRRRINLKYSNGIYGFFEKNSKNIVDFDNCLNVVEEINEVIKIFKNFKFKNLDSLDIFYTGIVVSINMIFSDEPEINDFKQLNVFEDKNCIISYTYSEKQNYITIIGTVEDIKLNLNNLQIIVPQNCFLQVAEESQNFMINTVKKAIEENLSKKSKIADLYCGIGTYSFPLAKNGCKIFSYEGDRTMIDNIKKNIITNNIKNIFPYQKDLFNQPLSVRELNEFDIIIINPPRNGAENQCKNIVKSNVKKVVYISCNPQSLARDLKLFKNNGFEIKKIVMVDQFYLSEHVESIVILEKIVN